MTIQEGERNLIRMLVPSYGEREATAIGDRVMEHLLNLKKIDRIINKSHPLSMDQEVNLLKFQAELSELKPLQYVIGEAWFMGMKFFVDENVLIPRPETEELVQWVIDDLSVDNIDSRILDIGTGSGCIPIALKNKLPGASLFSCDISEGALAIAKRNASSHQVSIEFYHLDFLDDKNWTRLPESNVIVSNPPYVAMSEFESLEKNVSQFEPHAALFVADSNALIFYEAIVEFAKTKLLAGGKIFVELNQGKADEVKSLFSDAGFVNVELRKDMHGNDRMIKATWLL